MRDEQDELGWKGIDLGRDYTRLVQCLSCRKFTVLMHNAGPTKCGHCGDPLTLVSQSHSV